MVVSGFMGKIRPSSSQFILALFQVTILTAEAMAGEVLPTITMGYTVHPWATEACRESTTIEKPVVPHRMCKLNPA